MEISTRHRHDVTILTLVGRLAGPDGAKRLHRSVRSSLDSGRRKILLDLTQVSFIDSTGLGVLISCLTSCTTRDGIQKLLNPAPKVEDVLRITDTHKLFEIYFEEDEAVRSFEADS